MKIRFFILVLFVFPSAFAALIYTPPNFKPPSARLVVVIHGCLQSGEAMAFGTGWNQIAANHNLAVLYPQVPEGTNPLGCWSWYLPENQRSDRGQLRLIFDEITATKNLLQLKDSKIFLAGISSGSATVAGLIACFPNEFTAAALHSGPSYGLAQNIFEGDRVLKEGPPKNRPQMKCNPSEFQGRLILIQGTEDKMVNPKNADQVIADFASDTKVMPAKNQNDGGLNYQVIDYWNKNSLKLRFVNIQGLGHAWSGFVKNLRYGPILGPDSKSPTIIPFFSKEGPSATNLAWDFFNQTTSPSR